MIVKYTLKLMYGDADGYKTNTYIAKDENEIMFLDYFVSHYDELSHLYRFDLGSLEDDDCVEPINSLIMAFNKLAIKRLSSGYTPYSQIDNASDATDVCLDILECVQDLFHWDFYNSGLQYYGVYESHSIEDISNKKLFTKKELETILGYEIKILF